MQRIAAVIRGAWVLLGVLAFVFSAAHAEPLATSARQLPPGSLKLLTYYQGVQDQNVRFDVRGTGSCATAGSGITFGCDTAGDIDGEGTGGMGVVKLVYQPWDSLQYYGSVGIGDYVLRVPSTTVINDLHGDDPSVSGTFGIKWVFYPDTIVTPALALDASLTRTHHSFNRIDPGGTPGRSNEINESLDLWQYQVAVETSHLFTIEEKYKLEPYGGLKWIRTQSDLHDKQTGSHAGGQLDTVTPFIGLKAQAFEHESFFAEASQFLDGYQYAAGLEIRFK